MKELILGGVRSGKSRLALSRAQTGGHETVVIATATAMDDEMALRIQRHRSERPANVVTVEEPIALAQALSEQAAPWRCVIVDCLTLWITNLLLAEEGVFARERTAFLDAIASLPGHVIFVSNETGLGVMPADPLSRRFCDEAGFLHQALAARCDRVTFTVAGLPLILKGTL